MVGLGRSRWGSAQMENMHARHGLEMAKCQDGCLVHKEPLGVFVRLLCEFSMVFQPIMHFPFLRACSSRAVPTISPFLLNVPSRLATMGGRILAPGKEPPTHP